jgi:hypothetical protein
MYTVTVAIIDFNLIHLLPVALYVYHHVISSQRRAFYVVTLFFGSQCIVAYLVLNQITKLGYYISMLSIEFSCTFKLHITLYTLELHILY